MAKPQTKQELILLAQQQYQKMWAFIDAMSDEQQNAVFQFGDHIGKEAHWTRDQNIRDILIHLYEWHELLLNWVSANQKGQKQPFLPEPYNIIGKPMAT